MNEKKRPKVIPLLQPSEKEDKSGMILLPGLSVTREELERELEKARKLMRKKKEAAEAKQAKRRWMCGACKTMTVVANMVAEPFTTSTIIGVARPLYEDGGHCTTCGIHHDKLVTPKKIGV